MKRIKYALFLCLTLLAVSCSDSDDDTSVELNPGTDGAYTGFFDDSYRLSPYEEKDNLRAVREHFKFTCSMSSEEDNETFEVTDVLSRARYDLVLNGSSATLTITKARIVEHKYCYVVGVTYTYEPGTYEFDFNGQHFVANVLSDVIMLNGRRCVDLKNYQQTTGIVKETGVGWANGNESTYSINDYTLNVSDTQDGGKILSNGTTIFQLTKLSGGYELRQIEPESKPLVTLARQ